MELIVFEKEAYYRMQKEMMEMMKKAIKEAKLEAVQDANPMKDWISTTEAMKLLGIKSRTTMQQLRDNGDIAYSRHGNSKHIKYSRKSILEYYERNKHDVL